MTIDLVSEKDCIGVGKHKNYVICRKGRIKRITNRDRKRCFKCGHDNGIWHEQFLRGRSVYHFLCRDCIDTIENGKG